MAKLYDYDNDVVAWYGWQTVEWTHAGLWCLF